MATDPNNQEDRWDCIQSFYQLINQEADVNHRARVEEEEGGAPLSPFDLFPLLRVAIRLLAHKIQSPQEKEALQALTVLEACMNNCGKRFHSEAAKFRFLNELIKLLTPKYFGAWTPQSVKDRVTEVLYGWTLWLKDEPKIQEAYSMLKKQDLETANRLIKSTIQEEQEKAEKVLKRESTLKEVESSTKQLRELLDQNTVTGTPTQPSDDMKALYERCDRLRPGLFRLASDTTDDDAALAQILAANDELTFAVNAYKEHVGKKECNGGTERKKSVEEVMGKNSAPTSPREIKSYHLIDLSALDSSQTHRKAESPPPSPPLFSSYLETVFHPAADQDSAESASDNKVSKQTQETPRSYYEELMQLNGDVQVGSGEQNGGTGVLLRARGCGGSSLTSNGTNVWSLPQHQQFSGSGSSHQTQTHTNGVCGESVCPPQLLKNIFVPMETIRSSQLEPITVYDQGGVHVSLHFARDSPPGHPEVAVVVISTVNTSALDVRDFLFQAAVPKRKVRLRYKLTLTHGEQQLNETGEIDNFPDWTSLIGR
ncbi:hypothetical protein INR49_016171 [Caranx melampygus]|nr:hypothetical protein INR49_016171 [Caranx melampygus]